MAKPNSPAWWVVGCWQCAYRFRLHNRVRAAEQAARCPSHLPQMSKHHCSTEASNHRRQFNRDTSHSLQWHNCLLYCPLLLILWLIRAITFQEGPVDVLVFGLGECWVLVEQVGHEGQVQFGVATDHVSRRDELAAAQPVRLLQHELCPAQVVLLLQGCNAQQLSWNTPGYTAQQMGSSWPLSGAMSQVHVWHQSLTRRRDEAHTPTPAAVPLSCLVLLFFLPFFSFQAHMLSNFNAFGTQWLKRSQYAPKWSKTTEDFSIVSVNWRVVTRLAASTHWAHTWGVHMVTDTVHALEIKIPGYPDVMGQWQGTGSSGFYRMRTWQSEYLHWNPTC